MSTTASFYVEMSIDGRHWLRDADRDGEAGCSGWLPLLGLTSAPSTTPEPFPALGTRGYPDDMADETVAALLSDLHLVRDEDDGSYARDENTSFAWFTLADLHDIQRRDADFIMDRRGYTKHSTIDSARDILDAADQHSTDFGVPAQHIRFIVSLS